MVDLCIYGHISLHSIPFFKKCFLLLILGVMELPVSQLHQLPHESRIIREPDPTFIRNLKFKMVSDPSAPGATPIAVLCKDCESTELQLEVQEGVQIRSTRGYAHFFDEYPDNPYFKVAMSNVYVGLSDEEALRLAQHHNTNSHLSGDCI